MSRLGAAFVLGTLGALVVLGALAPKAAGAPKAANTPKPAGASKATGKPTGRVKAPPVTPADIKTIRAAIDAPGAAAVLVNVWATWCEPCREEMPGLVRFFQKNRGRGLRLVLISADPRAQRARVAAFLRRHGVDVPSFLKTGDDQAFIDGIDKAWGGTLPVSILYDGSGAKRHMWDGVAAESELQAEFDRLLAGPGTSAVEPGSHEPKPRSTP